MKFLCLGYGSAGKRHASILETMGHEVISVDPLPAAGAQYRFASTTQAVPETLLVKKPEIYDGLLDCRPVDSRSFWGGFKAYFIEKPLGESWASLLKPAQIGFCYRWLPSLETFIARLARLRIYSVVIVSGQWLPDWHPGVDYRGRYHGKPGRGGVILDSLPHSLFVARWIMGDVKVVGAVKGRLSGLDIRTEDTAGILLEAPAGQPVYILADYLRRSRAFYIEVVTSRDVQRWEFDPKEADQMYQRQMEVFCEVCEGKRQYGYPDLQEGLEVQVLLVQVLADRFPQEGSLIWSVKAQS